MVGVTESYENSRKCTVPGIPNILLLPSRTICYISLCIYTFVAIYIITIIMTIVSGTREVRWRSNNSEGAQRPLSCRVYRSLEQAAC